MLIQGLGLTSDPTIGGITVSVLSVSVAIIDANGRAIHHYTAYPPQLQGASLAPITATVQDIEVRDDDPGTKPVSIVGTFLIQNLNAGIAQVTLSMSGLLAFQTLSYEQQ